MDPENIDFEHLFDCSMRGNPLYEFEHMLRFSMQRSDLEAMFELVLGCIAHGNFDALELILSRFDFSACERLDHFYQDIDVMLDSLAILINSRIDDIDAILTYGRAFTYFDTLKSANPRFQRYSWAHLPPSLISQAWDDSCSSAIDDHHVHIISLVPITMSPVAT